MEPLQLGLIGLGGMGRSHLSNETTSAAVRFVGVSDVVAATVQQVSTQYDIPGYDDYRKLLDSGRCEAVLIATPHPFHPTIALEAIRRGIHVLSEKPIAVSVTDADRMIEAAEKAGVKLGVMFQTRTIGVYQRARQLLGDGAIGRLYRSVLIATHWYRSQAYYNSGSWRGTWKGEGGGILLNQLPHSLDMFIWLGGKPSRVLARAETRGHQIEVEDTIEALLDYEPGHSGYLYATTAEWPGEDRYEFTGERGKLVIQGKSLRLYRSAKPLSESLATGTTWEKPEGSWEDIEISEAPSGHRLVVEQFARAVRLGEPLVATGIDGLNSLELANALLLSGYRGHPVSLPVDRAEYDRFLAEKRGD